MVPFQLPQRIRYNAKYLHFNQDLLMLINWWSSYQSRLWSFLVEWATRDWLHTHQRRQNIQASHAQMLAQDLGTNPAGLLYARFVESMTMDLCQIYNHDNAKSQPHTVKQASSLYEIPVWDAYPAWIRGSPSTDPVFHVVTDKTILTQWVFSLRVTKMPKKISSY